MRLKHMKGLDELRVRVCVLKTNSAMRIRRPVRADIHSMLCRFFQIEEHTAPENTQERRASEYREGYCKRSGKGKSVIHDIDD